MPNHPDRIYTPPKGGFAVSRLRQVDGSSYSDPLTAAALGLSFDVTDDVTVSFWPEYEIMGNAGKLSGSMWPDAWYKGSSKPGELKKTFDQLKPHELLWAFAMFCGDVDAAAQVGSGQGYRHKMRFQADSQKRGYYYSACSRLGPEASGVAKLLMYGCQMNTLNLKIERGASFCSLETTSKVLGKYKTNVFRERVLKNQQDTSLTLNTKAVEGSTAQERLDSILGIVADIQGDGSTEYEVIPTAASDATPAVITLHDTVTPLGKFRKVFTLIDGEPTDHGDGQTAFVIALGDTSDELLVGSYRRHNHYTFTSSVQNALAVTLESYYYASDGTWTADGDLVDGTEAGGATFNQTGEIIVNMPTDWERTRLGHDLLNSPRYSNMYWRKFKVTGALTATTAGTIAISQYEDIDYIQFDNDGTFEGSVAATLAAAKSATGSNFYNTITITTSQDTMYIGFKNGYPRGLKWLIDAGTPNAIAAVCTAKYYNGAWVDLLTAHNYVDGTIDTGCSLGQSGNMTWDQISDGVATSINSQSAYWIALTWDATLTANITFQMIAAMNRNVNYSVFYRGEESVSFSEGSEANWPTQITNEETFNPSGTTVLMGGTFDSTTETIKNGVNLECRIMSIDANLTRDLGDAEQCIDGSDDNYPKKPKENSKPSGTITLTLEGDTPKWWLQHEFLNQGSLPDTEDVQRFCMALILGSPIPIPGYATDDLYPNSELSMPYCGLKTAPMGIADDIYTCTVTLDVGADNTNSYRPFYLNGVSLDSSSYAQTS